MTPLGSAFELAGRSFRLLRQAGSGGFGSVWQAVTESGRIVALKWAHDAAGAQALAKEAEVAALALSPRLPELVDVGWALVPPVVASGSFVGTTSGPTPSARPFVAFTWVDGVPLDARPVKEGPEGVREALVVAADAAEALADLHGIGAGHGDVKPQNLIVDARGRVHAIDLGLCVGAFSTDLAGATARYLAAEDGDLGDARARDLLALGVVLAERASATVRAARDAVAVARAAVLPAPLDEICGAILSRSPTARASARWVADTAIAALCRPGEHAEERADRDARAVRASYLRSRRAEIGRATRAEAGTAPWLAEALALAARARSLLGPPRDAVPSPVPSGPSRDAGTAHVASGTVPAPLGTPHDEGTAHVASGTVPAPLATAHDEGKAHVPSGPAHDEGTAPAPLGTTLEAGTVLAPLPLEGIVRWLVLLCGPHAAAWPVPLVASVGEVQLAEALSSLARRLAPEAWTFHDVEEAVTGRAADAAERSPHRTAGADGAPRHVTRTAEIAGEMDAGTAARLALAVAEVPPDALAVSSVEADRRAPAPLVLAAADALRRSGQLGRARSLVLREGVLGATGGRAIAADVLRRAGDTAHARAVAEEAIRDHDDAGGRARATLARIALDEGRIEEAHRLSAGAGSALVAEVAALAAHRAGDGARALAEVARGEALARTPEERARLAAVRGYVLHATDQEGAFAAFSAAVEYAMRAGAVVEEATYRTGLAASAVDLGDLGVAITSARRAAVLWEVLGRPALAARALLACSAAHATARAAHEARAAAREAIERAREGGDKRAEAYASWSIADALPSGDPEARAASEDADGVIEGPSADDALRSAVRLLRHGSPRLTAVRRRAAEEAAMEPANEVTVRLEWWGARAETLASGDADLTSGAAREDGLAVLQALLALADARAPVGARGPALFAGYELAARLGRSDAAGRLLAACHEVTRQLGARAPAELSSHVRALPWAAPSALGGDGMKLEQAAELERILRTLADRERLGVLLDRVVDALVLWTGVERGLLLMRAPDGRLLPRAARNLARADLSGEQLALSHTLAARALETRAPVVAVDAAGELSSVVQSVHALKLRSVLALPLIARGEVLGVVYLDDRLRRGAFGPRELSWAQTIAQLAAVAILDARTNVLLRRAVRRAERASAELAETLAKREAEVDSLARELSHQRTGRATRHRYERIIGDSDAIQKLLALVDRVTISDVPVLVFGESGSGKELLARAIHDNGPRAAKPFVGENCGAIPEGLLESALFGHVRGAFTGADRPRSGLFEVADRGTLFLDEIGEMSLPMQTKLLRVLEDGMVKPLGSERARKVDVRVIAATHRDLEAMVKARTFREDLYYRLHIVALRIPPLRARPSDIPLLVQHFVKAHAKGADVRVTKGAMAKLLVFPWPGNVRQLENEIRRAIVLSDGVIDAEQLSPEVAGATTVMRVVLDGLNVRDRIDALEVELVQRALERTRGNQTQAAKLLGLSRFGLQKMMKRLGVPSSSASSASASPQPETAPS